MSTMKMQKFEYAPVAQDGSEFRVFSFSRPQGRYDDVAIELIPASTIENSTPLYEAISYVWGTDTNKKRILVNGSLVELHHSLYYILEFLQRTIKRGNFLWADALCINQDNLEEKAVQINLMGSIYSRAALVRIFPCSEFESLGFDTRLAADLVERMSELDDGSDTSARSDLLPLFFDDLVKVGFPKEQDVFYRHLKHLYSLPWFRRLWIIQEAVLAPHGKLVVHCGSSAIPWDTLHNLTEVMQTSRMSASFSPTSFSTDLPCSGRLPVTGWARLMDIQVLRETTGLALTEQLWNVRDAMCSNPFDRVYGVLSLAKDEVRNAIAVDYTLEDHTVVYNMVSMFALNDIPTLWSLQLACTEERLPRQPSWCSNLASPLECHEDPFGSAGGAGEPKMWPHIGYSIDRRKILLQGFCAGAVMDVLEVDYQSCHRDAARQGHPECGSTRLYWYARCCQFAKSGGHSLIELRRVLTGCLNVNSYTDRRLLQEVGSVISYWLWQQFVPQKFMFSVDEVNQHEHDDTTYIISSLNQGRRLIRTNLGGDQKIGGGWEGLGVANKAVECGDLIYVFEGENSQHPLIFRPIPGDAGEYRFIGDSWVMGLMKGEALHASMELERRELWVV